MNPGQAARSCPSCFGPVSVEGNLMLCQTEGCPAYGQLLTMKSRHLSGVVGS